MTALKNPSLNIADDRHAWFEAIRDPNDPLLIDRRNTSKPLVGSDYLSEFSQNVDLLTQHRLYAMKAKIAAFQANQQREESKEQQRKSMIQGLLG